jgi:hypothetical protein
MNVIDHIEKELLDKYDAMMALYLLNPDDHIMCERLYAMLLCLSSDIEVVRKYKNKI